MREIYHWTEWFSELANKIAEGGEEILIERAKRIAWKADGKEPPLLRYGDKKIDPFSFFYSLAQHRSSVNRKLVYRSVENIFNMKHQYSEEQYDSNDAFIFPTANPQNLLYYSNVQADPKLLWNLFRSAVRGLDSVDPKHFDDALELRGVRKAKLTQTLFLINSSQFLPCDDKTKTFVDLPPNDEFSWKSYREWLQKVHDIFPSCGPYEINFSPISIVSGSRRIYLLGTNIFRSARMLGVKMEATSGRIMIQNSTLNRTIGSLPGGLVRG